MGDLGELGPWILVFMAGALSAWVISGLPGERVRLIATLVRALRGEAITGLADEPIETEPVISYSDNLKRRDGLLAALNKDVDKRAHHRGIALAIGKHDVSYLDEWPDVVDGKYRGDIPIKYWDRDCTDIVSLTDPRIVSSPTLVPRSVKGNGVAHDPAWPGWAERLHRT